VEARSHRSVDALLSAYRVGARVAWQEQADMAVRHGVPAATVADFAALVFAYIDELSAASVAGHTGPSWPPPVGSGPATSPSSGRVCSPANPPTSCWLAPNARSGHRRAR
jgi:hypothetical protein